MAGQPTPAAVTADEFWRRFVDAVIAFRARDISAAQSYLRWVEQQRGREVAEQAKLNVMRCATAKSWVDVEQWPARGYVAKPPPDRREENLRRQKR